MQACHGHARAATELWVGAGGTGLVVAHMRSVEEKLREAAPEAKTSVVADAMVRAMAAHTLGFVKEVGCPTPFQMLGIFDSEPSDTSKSPPLAQNVIGMSPNEDCPWLT